MIIQIDIEQLLEAIAMGGLIGLILTGLAVYLGYLSYKIRRK